MIELTPEQKQVERDIEIAREGSYFVITDIYKNIVKYKKPIDYMRYFDNIFTQTTQVRQQIENEVKTASTNLKQNEELMDALRPMYNTAKVEHKIEVMKYQRAGKKEGTA